MYESRPKLSAFIDSYGSDIVSSLLFPQKKNIKTSYHIYLLKMSSILIQMARCISKIIYIFLIWVVKCYF